MRYFSFPGARFRALTRGIAWILTLTMFMVGTNIGTVLADPNPCTVTSNGMGGWNVSCVSTPPALISPVDFSDNGSNGSGGNTGAVVVPPTNGSNGNNGGNDVLFYPGSPGSFAIEFPGAPAGIFVQTNGGTGGGGGDADVCVCGGAGGGNGGNGGDPFLEVDGNLPIFTDASGVAGIWLQSAGGIGGNGGNGNGALSAGSGGNGGYGGNIQLNAYDAVTTVGDYSYGVFAQSIGGGGGTGGGGLNFGGGSGGTAEAGGNVVLNLGLAGGGEPGVVATYGHDSIGVLAQSVGGFGGAGGSATFLVGSVSGGGGNGGNGGSVTVNSSSDSSIVTYGDDSTGLVAESIGGAGGEGGSGGSLFFTEGGSGSAGGSGGSVNVTNEATITTFGAAAKGILAQSIGGGGGDGGSSSSLLVSLGGAGSSTSPGGDVSVFNTGNITTNTTISLSSDAFFGASAIYAQSIGGGGGNGGSSFGLFSVGGSGGGGGDGGTVSVSNFGSLLTNADDSNGIFAQSVGGGGGNGGGSVAVGPVFSLAVGGSAGVGGNGMDTNVFSENSISTFGNNSNGIQAQSLGGGGGNGGFAIAASAGIVSASLGIGGTGGAGGNGSTVEVTSFSSIGTTGSNANGIFAQSVGGGGGSGGFSVSASAGIASLSLGFGGSGGTAGNGDVVTLLNFGGISTQGSGANGIIAQSVGGGGGSGGFSVTGDVGAASGGFSFGGNGSSGGNGADVSLTNFAGILTQGVNANDLIAQSVGGGGGNGGFSVTGNASFYGSLGMSMGGTGAGGGNSGNVSLTNAGVLETEGDNSIGLLAQSLGGGGGNGGFSVTGNVSVGPNGGLGIGGNGGSGGNAGTVSATNTGSQVLTLGNDADALFAQSVGGGGGNGGFSVTGGISGSATFNAAIGGGGGTGGSASTVTLNNGAQGSNANIGTFGEHSNGIVAQSLGGGGGNGGFTVGAGIASGAAVNLGVGGSGGTGANGGNVTVTSYGNVQTGLQSEDQSTTADFADAILAQSVAGGGGNGGFSVAGGLAEGVTANLGLGGTGGSGGSAGNVLVDSTGFISTNGDHSVGILAQSIGGGGGNGGFAVAGGLATGAAIGVSVGGSGSGGGAGGYATINNIGGVQTTGDDSDALFAQSVGGGGGTGGFSVSGNIGGAAGASISLGGNGGAGASASSAFVSSSAGSSETCNPDRLAAGNGNCVPNPATITTFGNRSDGIAAQSIGGGGGAGGFSVGAGGGYAAALSASIGGSGGAGGTAGMATVNSVDNITTSGDSSIGIFAESVGGGGGSGGFSVAGGVSDYLSGSLAIGGTGGNGASAAGAYVSSNGTIATAGNNAADIFAQSIGGSGGDGGFSVAGSIAEGPAAGISLGGSGGFGSTGGGVTVFSQGPLSTQGNDAAGIFAQSLGGGGGNGGFSVAGGLSGTVALDLSIGGFGGDGGTSGNVSVTNGTDENASTIATMGDYSDGIGAQSIGGSGGNGGFSIAGGVADGPAISLSLGGFGGSGATAGSVSVSQIGSITTGADGGSGNFSNGLRAQSIGGNGGNGGFSIAAGLSSSVGASVSIGGFGESGADAGSATVTYGDLTNGVFGGTILTSGNQANGIFAESLGGGGGNGGFSVGASVSEGPGVNFSLGGFGGDGGAGSTVGVTNFGNIGTLGNNSNGILAQSIGGGGGNGGFSIAGTLSDAPSAAATVGGFGGSGANAGDVTVFSIGGIGTAGNNSDAIMAQSVGGGGGNGGFSVAGDISNGAAAALSVGGFGGSAGTGGNVFVSALNPLTAVTAPTIFTEGSQSDAILSQSVGGGGGNGGFSVAGVVNNGYGLSASLGGFAGSGASAGSAGVLNSATIATFGDQSDGIAAQSIGGSGGNGGWSVAGTVSNSTSAALSVGGFGGTGGNGSTVAVTNAGIGIVTLGSQSVGLLAQSLGGGGGNGGFSIGGDLSNSNGLSATLGGFGGAAGDAGRVSVVSGGTSLVNFIGTAGAQSDGILAQSIGGGGGNGGWTVAGNVNDGKGAALDMGGIGGGGGNGDGVSVTANTLVITTGDQSAGIVAQSIGGGGGNGGWSVAGDVSNGTNVALALGGNGGNAGNAGTVSLTSGQNVTTSGNNAAALMAQSIGGGGGNGGFSVGAGFANSGFQLADSFGGNGGSAGSGSDVTLDSGTAAAPVTLTTFGASSNGILAQSIGGGGGNGGFTVNASATGDSDGQPDAAKFGMAAFNIGYGTCTVCPGSGGGDANNAGNVTVNSVSTITTNGDNSADIVAQSLGGGGGNGAITVGASVDKTGPSAQIMFGAGGGGGNGGDVSVSSVNNLLTNGSNSDGILAQSIGGGGGFGGLSATNGFITDVPGLAGLDLGQHGDQGGNAGDVDVSNASNIQTIRGDSAGIVAQSIGGGGGEGGWSIQGGFSLEQGTASSVLNYAFGSNGGAGGSAGNVSVTSTAATIATLGASSDGMLAQSVGGGGGNGGFAINVAYTPGWAVGFSMGGQGGAAGDAGAVEVTNATQITTAGDLSGGIIAQSIGGGGGSGGFAIEVLGTTGLTANSAIGGFSSGGTDGGSVAMQNTGVISTAGEGADDILAESIGGGGGNGGFAIDGAVTSGRGAFFSLGGSGSSGGNGGPVTVENNAASLSAVGNNSQGFVAESLGGGGGDGGFSIAGGYTSGGTLDLGIGGFSAAGGNGGTVVAVSGNPATTTTIFTQGNDADGFLAESIGGGGGNGGFSIAGGVTGGPSINLGIGAGGSTGGDGGTVYATNDSSIKTTGINSDAMVAQSFGGGGGNGGFAIAATLSGGNSAFNGTLSLGGNSGTGGAGGVVFVSKDATGIETTGDLSDGILAQSIGGGGGNGGFSIAGTGSLGTRNLVLGIGGNGGTGGASDGVTVNSGESTGATFILTKGAFSDGILAQAIGGGGGNGGFAVEGLASMGTSFGYDLGGSGGSGNNGGATSVTNFSGIATSGASALGIGAQSIGGGGGAGGFKVTATVASDSNGFSASSSFGFGNGGGGGDASTVNVTNDGLIATRGVNADGILAQSVGGGGGYGGFSYATQLLGDLGIGMGSSTDGGGAGGNVTVTNTASIGTFGNNAGDIVAQSIGGGGGAAGFNISGALNTNPTSSILSGLTFALGSNGGAGGNAGNVSVISFAPVLFTEGDNADGIVAQSVGGGGGDGGFAVAANLTNSQYGLGLSLGGAGGSAGDGGTISIGNASNIFTTGDFSDGIFGQSVGGGGGNGGYAVNVLATQGLSGNVAVGGSGGSAGSGGAVTIDSALGTIVTTGLGSDAIVGQSIGGGGGNGAIGVAGFLIGGVPLLGVSIGGNSSGGGSGGAVTVANASAAGTGGMFANALLAQSIGGGGGSGLSSVADATNSALSGPVNLGTTGGFGGDGGFANAGDAALTVTTGLGASAVVAQSVGGGGGIAGFDVVHNVSASGPGGLTFGASDVSCPVGIAFNGNCSGGGFAGSGSAVVAINSQGVATTGDASDAIVAQSVGGGGGLGTFAVGGRYTGTSLEISEGANNAFGDGGNVLVLNGTAGVLLTRGFHSDGIVAQSIGGGGGQGTVMIGGAISGGTTAGYELGATANGDGEGAGGSGGVIGVGNAAAIFTRGDFSTAILAQSIGGGGGDGAFQFGGAIGAGGLGLVSLLGGSNLSADANGGAVTVANNGALGVMGSDAFGILAQSIGGGGGNGGFAGTVDDTLGTPSLAGYLVGGIDNDGTTGGAVTATNTGAITTRGLGDAALVAQSIGGGGGEAGYALDLALGTSGATHLDLLVGDSGSNNTAGATSITNSGTIATMLANANGVLAQSIGGGGGNGGLSAFGTLTTGSASQFDVQVGGSGGTANNAGTVGFTSKASIFTAGDGSVAIAAQSIGGGGGNAELSFSGAFSSGTPNNASLNVGATAMGSGTGNTVTLTNSGAIQTGSMLHGATTGAFADGILAQSIGGGGGSGVLTMGLGAPTGKAAAGTVNVNVGGVNCAVNANGVAAFGGCGFAGGAILLSDSGAITTAGADAAGIEAQSIGDGGGDGAADIFGTHALAHGATAATYALDITVGGGGGIANTGGNVSLTHGGGTLATFGNDADAIDAQSIGGGGGNGGSLRSILETPGACSTSSTTCSAQLVGANISVGGFGLGQSNSGGTVSVANTGNLETTGIDADAILAQSIGGGGGVAGNADDTGIKSFALAVGGTQFSGGNGNTVNVSDAGNITTESDGSSAIFAQSIGGGGGVGGLGLFPSATGTISLGGTGGANGNGGNVNVTMCCGPSPHVMANLISTTGDSAFGIFAQSVGGGGGLAGDANPGVNLTAPNATSLLTASGGGGGNGGAVTVSDLGNISTTGEGADGSFAQSVGGGGGLTTGFAGSAGAAGSGGAVSVTQDGILATTGFGATAIFAQSAGGTGKGGNVTVNVTGEALAYGANADGILAQSVGGAGNGNIGITINAGSIVQGGTGSGSAGVAILGGASNTLLNLGTITTASSPDAAHYPFNTYRFNTAAGIESTQLASTGNYQTTSLMTDNSALLAAFIGTDMSKQQGTAIFANAGTLTLTNDGDIYGSIVLDGATLDLINKGVIVSGSQLNFGSDGTLMLGSGSLMTPGGGGFVATTNLTGNLREMPGSNYLVNLDLTNNTASNFNVSGFASVAGTVDLDLLSTNAAAPGTHAESIITAAGGVTNNGLTLAPPQSAVASFSLAYQPDDVLLDYDINYAPTTGDVLNHNDLAFGDYVGRIQTAGSTPKLASFMSTVFAIPTVADLKGFYDRFSPDTSVALSSAALLSNMQFSDAMLNCHADNSFTQQSGGCNWGTIGTQNSGQTASSSSDGFAQSALDFAAGFEHKIGNGLTSIGAAVHYANGSLSDSDAATTLTGGTLSAGFSASHVLNDGVVLSADLFGGDGHYESGRTVGYPAVTTQATGTQELSFIGTHLRADRYFGNSINSVTPYLDLGLTQVNVGELDESGAGIFDENVAAHHDVLPTVAFGARFEKQFHRKATQFRLALDASATQLLGNAQSLTTATLAGAPAGVTPFVLTNTMDRTYFGLTPSLEITHNDKLGVRISGSYNFSASTHSLGTYVQFTTKLGGGSL